ncbi:SGNH hydrolase-type esterase domain-containing protein [Umbelopsis sp. AD052]|nr:SGNH hydrolase-type esterase domain-containing protein [Umbelopsis sp. AD052]
MLSVSSNNHVFQSLSHSLTNSSHSLSNSSSHVLSHPSDYLFQRSIGYAGSGNRIREKLAKASNGEDIKIGVLGGSISTGHKLEDKSKEVYHSVLFDWFTSKFPYGQHTLVNGAAPATGSSYFTYCHGKHIPDDLDIIFIEFSINDGSIYPTERGDGDPGITKNMELLVRNLMQMPNKPAIVFLSFFSFKVDYYFNGQEAHMAIANYYDIPYISFKNAYYDHHNRFPKDVSTLFSSDEHHPNKEGHRMMSAFVIRYLESIEGVKAANTPDADIPLLDMWTTRKHKANFSELNPFCETFMDKTYQPSYMDGWYLMNWKKEKYYIASDSPGSLITFSVEASKGSVYMYILKSSQYDLGSVWCWADDDRDNGRELSGHWNISRSIGHMMLVSDSLSKGRHDIHCQVLPGDNTHFRIIAIFSG